MYKIYDVCMYVYYMYVCSMLVCATSVCECYYTTLIQVESKEFNKNRRSYNEVHSKL